MSLTTKTWSIRLIGILLICAMPWVNYDILFRSSVDRKASHPHMKHLCDIWSISQSWDSLHLNVSRNKKLFLTLKDFFWEHPLDFLPLPYGVKGSEPIIVKALVGMTNYDIPDTVKKLSCKTCVVVGNGYVIKNNFLGSTINKYDVVIRLNNAPLRGYEEDVGNKTSIRFFYPESASLNPAIDNDPDTLMVLVPFKEQDIRWIKEILYNEKRTSKGFWRPPPKIWLGKKSHIRILDPYFLRKTASKLLHLSLETPTFHVTAYFCMDNELVVNLRSTKTNVDVCYPTTGILAVYTALNFCDVVHVAGFGYPPSSEEGHLIHYYGNDTMKDMKKLFHNITTEQKALQKLRDSGAIAFLHPTRN